MVFFTSWVFQIPGAAARNEYQLYIHRIAEISWSPNSSLWLRAQELAISFCIPGSLLPTPISDSKLFFGLKLFFGIYRENWCIIVLKWFKLAQNSHSQRQCFFYFIKKNTTYKKYRPSGGIYSPPQAGNFGGFRTYFPMISFNLCHLKSSFLL